MLSQSLLSIHPSLFHLPFPLSFSLPSQFLPSFFSLFTRVTDRKRKQLKKKQHGKQVYVVDCKCVAWSKVLFIHTCAHFLLYCTGVPKKRHASDGQTKGHKNQSVNTFEFLCLKCIHIIDICQNIIRLRSQLESVEKESSQEEKNMV